MGQPALSLASSVALAAHTLRHHLMQSFIFITALILALALPSLAAAQGDLSSIPQPITVLKRPTIPANAELDVLIAAEPSQYGQFRLEKTEECDKNVFFDRAITQKQEHKLLQMETCSEYTSTISKIGDVDFPFITPSGEEFHLFQVQVNAGNGTDAVWTIYQVVVLDKNKAWVSEQMTIVPVYLPQLERSVELDVAYISQQQGKTVLSLVVPPTTKSAGENFLISMGSFEKKLTDPLPRWVKSTRTLKMVGTFQEETDTARGNLPCISGKETSMDADVPSPTDQKEYCIHKMGTCTPPPDENYEGVPAEMTLLETVWSDGDREYSCLYIKGL